VDQEHARRYRTPNHRPLPFRSSTTASCATIIGCVRNPCRPSTSVPSSAPSHLPTFQGHRASPSHPHRPDRRAKSAESSTFNLQKSRTVRRRAAVKSSIVGDELTRRDLDETTDSSSISSPLEHLWRCCWRALPAIPRVPPPRGGREGWCANVA
jgi:hypothetical protein